MAVTVGYNFGAVETLPSGVRIGEVVSDSNVLSSLPKRTTGNGFFAVSSGFLNPGAEVLKKPFADAGEK
jgi:hypothetical protein